MRTIDITEDLTLKERIERREVPFDPSEYQAFIDKMNTGDFSLSFTSIKEFASAPLDFLRYKIGKKPETDSMRLGDLEHTMILEPEKFYDKFLILEKPKGFEEFTWAKKENKIAKQNAEIEAATKELTVVTIDEVEKALEIKECILSNEVAGAMVNGCERYEQPVKFELFGFTWFGVIDAHDRRVILDLKKVADARPNKLRWPFQERKMNWQAFLYRYALKGHHDFYNICYDSHGRVSVVKMADFDIQAAQAQIEKACIALRECIIGDNWNQSLEFRTQMGYFESSEL